jgi:DNA-binding HxlR family transcriptional regulator
MSRELCSMFHAAVELIGRRWSGAVVQLLLQGPSRYAELRRAIPEITDRMLSERLRELEEAGIVIRHVIPEIPVRVEYALTEKGRALRPALEAIAVWAHTWGGVQEPPTEHARRGTPRRPAASRAPLRREHVRRAGRR